jgi:TIR domain
MKPQGLKVFLSYADRDDKLAQGLRIELEKGGFEVWDPVARLTPGDNWALEQGKALKDAEAIVVLLSPAALASDHVKREIDYALGEPRFKGRLLPVVVRPVKEIPWILETLQVLRIDADLGRGNRRVLEALKRIQTAA